MPSSTLAGGCPGHHAGLFTDMPHGLAMTNPCHASSRPPLDARGLHARRCGVDLASIRVRAGEAFMRSAEPAIAPFGSVRPVASLVRCESWRGHGCASGLWLQPSGENNFPCATRIPRAANSFRLPVLHCVAAARGAASPSPADRITTRTRWARPC